MSDEKPDAAGLYHDTVHTDPGGSRVANGEAMRRIAREEAEKAVRGHRHAITGPARTERGEMTNRDPSAKDRRIAELERELDATRVRLTEVMGAFDRTHARHRKLREAMDLIAMRQCPRGDFRCPETGDCITEWCEGCIGRRALAEDKEQGD